MKRPTCDRVPKTSFELSGFVADYVKGVTDQWLLVAPQANPAMLEMFRDRDNTPLRHMQSWAGEFAGKYLTGAVQVLRVTGDPRLRRSLRAFVSRLIRFQDQDGYLGPWPKECRLTNNYPGFDVLWDTWGHYHIMQGLLLWHEEAGDRQALECAARIADLICQKYLGKVDTRLVDTPDTEMNLAPIHALSVLYRKTKTRRYLDMALQIADEFAAQGPEGPLAGDYVRQALAGREFFQMPRHRWESLHAIMGLAELYWITGAPQYRRAFEHIWWSIAKLDRHNSGAFSSREEAVGNPYDINQIETCCTIAWIAMTAEMLKLTGSSVVADELELSTLNTVVAMHSHTGRWATYNTPMNGFRRASAHSIVFQSREGSPELNCCSVNSARGFGIVSDWALMRDREGLILNWYGPSKMSARLRPGLTVTFAQQTDYPISGRMHIRIAPSKPEEFALKLRIPYWSRKSTARLNGKPLPGVEPGRYLQITRKWRKGDTILLDLDTSLHFWAGERECDGLTSVYRGPILLTFDHRYNLHLPPAGEKKMRQYDEWKPQIDYGLNVPSLDAAHMSGRVVEWEDWIPPALLLEFQATNGSTVRLCDFGSAGEVGTPYMSWLPIVNAPQTAPFSRENPLRSARP